MPQTRSADREQGPTRVITSLYILDIGGIDDHKQEFTADVVIEARWRDPRLASGSNACRYNIDSIWHPWVQIFNQRFIHAYLEPQVQVDAQGTISYVQRYYGAFANPLELRRFPFDQQTLTLSLVSFYPSNEVKLVFNEKSTGSDEHLSISGWHVGNGTAAVNEYCTQSRHPAQEAVTLGWR